MSPLEAALAVAALALLLHYVIVRKLEQLEDPAYLRKEGVVIVRKNVIDARSEVIGEYQGRPIWASVTFMGMQYRFDHIVEDKQREWIEAGELYLEPGLVYALK
jgi:hypothetical protein